MFFTKKAAVVLSVFSNSILTVGKLLVGIFTGSVSIISEAIHSSLDLLASLVAFFSVRQSSKPADDQHKFGHGKFENVAAIIEALLILVAAGIIIAKAFDKLVEGGEIESLHLGLLVMGFSAIANFIISTILMKTAKRTESPALEADAWHLRTDVYTSLGVFVGITAIYFTKIEKLDPIIAFLVAFMIIKAAFDLIIKSGKSILDVRLSDEEEEKIKKILFLYHEEYVEFHKLRTRRSGSEKYIDLHLVVPYWEKISVVHELCQRIEDNLGNKINEINVLIHLEPCEPNGEYCQNCRFIEVMARNKNRPPGCCEPEKEEKDFKPSK